MKTLMALATWLTTPSSKVGLGALTAASALWAAKDYHGALIACSAGVGAILAPDSAAFQKAAADAAQSAPAAAVAPGGS
jgi:hypothetical protein